jgi:hypothetical protein
VGVRYRVVHVGFARFDGVKKTPALQHFLGVQDQGLLGDCELQGCSLLWPFSPFTGCEINTPQAGLCCAPVSHRGSQLEVVAEPRSAVGHRSPPAMFHVKHTSPLAPILRSLYLDERLGIVGGLLPLRQQSPMDCSRHGFWVWASSLTGRRSSCQACDVPAATIPIGILDRHHAFGLCRQLADHR